MEWININDRWPEKYQEVIICTNEGIVKSSHDSKSLKEFNAYGNVFLYFICKTKKRKVHMKVIAESPVVAERGC